MITIEILSIKDICEIHKKSIAIHGGKSGYYPTTLNNVDSTISNIFGVYFGFEKYPSIFDKAGALLYFFTKNHCFQDGNKRVGALTSLLFLLQNGYELTLDNDDLVNYALQVASSNFTGVALDNYIIKIGKHLEQNSIYFEDK